MFQPSKFVGKFPTCLLRLLCNF